MTAYYNEFDPFAAAWLRELMKEGHIAHGEVDERPIQQVSPKDLRGYTQCHFFAGIGGWSYALRLANWPDDKPIWTGSCPCQPFSSAGRQKGKADDRHLWPIWERLIGECRPATIFGEQVASAITHGWLDDVYQGLETLGYAVGAAVLPACSVGAPHKRDRLWFVANSEGAIVRSIPSTGDERGDEKLDCALANAEHDGSFGTKKPRGYETAIQYDAQGADSPGKFAGTSGFWDVETEWINCPDGKQRLVKSGLPLLANGIPNRVGKLRGYGNAIAPQVGAQFIAAFMDTQEQS